MKIIIETQIQYRNTLEILSCLISQYLKYLNCFKLFAQEILYDVKH
jgi:hypothetical protein